MKKRLMSILIVTLLVFQISFVQGFSAFAEDDEVAYNVEVYLSDDDDVYQLYLTTTYYAAVGSTISLTPEELEGFTYNAAMSSFTGIVASDGQTVLRMYYGRSVTYTVEVYQSDVNDVYQLYSTAACNAAVGSTVTLTPDEFAGFTFNAAMSSPTGIVASDGSTVFKMYYGRSVTYTIEIYQSDVNDVFQLYSTAVCYAAVGSTVTLTPEEFEGFTYNAAISSDTGAIASDGSTVYKLYYNRNNYTVEVYQGDLSDVFQLHSTITCYAAAGSSITVTPEEYEGFTYNAALSSVTGIISSDGQTVFKLYYYKNNYTVEVYKGDLNDVYQLKSTTYYAAAGSAITLSPQILAGFTYNAALSSTSGTITSDGLTVFKLYYDRNIVPYTIEVYQLDIYDEYQLYSTNTYNAKFETPISLTPDEFEGFTFNEIDSSRIGFVEADGESVFRMYYDRNEYMVHFSIGGSVYEEYLLYYGAPIDAPANPTPPLGHRFLGWYSTIPETMPARDLNIDGGWIAQEYLLSFMTDYDDTFVSYYLSYGTAITAPAVEPTKTGYTFVGWDSLPETMPAGDTQIDSLWEAKDYTMTFYLNGSVYSTLEQEYNSAVTAPTVTVEENNVFSGWSPAVPETMPSENTSYYATYGPEQFSITFPTSSDYTITPVVEGSMSASYGGSYSFTVTLSEAFDRSDISVYANGVEVTKVGDIYTVDNITSDVTISLSGVEINVYTVTYKIEGYSDTVYNVLYGQKITGIPSLPEKEGYSLEFAHWDIDLTDTAIYDDYTVNAVYSLTKFINFYVAGSGSVVYGSTNIKQYKSMEFAIGDRITVTAQDNLGEFLYWVNIATNKIISYDRTLTFTVATNMDYRALFAPKDAGGFTVTYLNNAGGIIFSEFVDYEEGYEVPAASPLPGFTFTSWDKTQSEVMASSGNVVVSPIYTVNPDVNTVTITNSYGVSGAGEYASFSNATVTAYGRNFSYWIDSNNKIVSYNQSYTFVINYNAVFTAVYGQSIPARRVATRITSCYKNYTDNKLTFYAERSVYSDLTVVQTGIILTKYGTVGTDASQFIIGGTNVLKGTGTKTDNNGLYSLTKASWDYANDTWYARSYVIVSDSSGTQYTYYSDIFSVPAGPMT